MAEKIQLVDRLRFAFSAPQSDQVRGMRSNMIIVDEVTPIGEEIAREVVSRNVQPLYELGSKKVTYVQGQPTYIQGPPTADPAYKDNSKPNWLDSSVYSYGVPADKVGYYGQQTQPAKQPSQPNKIASTDPRWGIKTAWASSELWTRQQNLETYSVEIAMLYTAISNIIARAGASVDPPAMNFTANFGSPVQNNTHRISVAIYQPIDLRVVLIRALVDGQLRWSSEVGVTDQTPIMAVDRLSALQGTDIEKPLPDSKTKKRRRVRF